MKQCLHNWIWST